MEDMISGIVAKSKIAIPVAECDYVKDGILYCGKCNTPKQAEYVTPWKTIKPMILCKCAKEEQERIEEERKAQEFADQVSRNKKNCYPKNEYDALRKKNFENADNCKIIKIAKKYVDNFPEFLKDGKGLTFLGGTGAGKSYAALCICNALLDKGYRCMFTNFSRIRNELSGMWEERQEYLDSFNKCSLLVFDDLGAESNTEYMKEIVHSIIDSRLRAGLPVIVTTNLTANQLLDGSDISRTRIYSRLFEMTVPVEVKHADRRKENVSDNCKKYSELLGI